MEERVELETVRVVLGGFANTRLWFLRTRGLHLIKQGVLIPFLQRCSQSRKASESCSKAHRAHLHGLTEYLGTAAASTGMFQFIENHPGIKISCTCSMGLCKFLALAPHVMKGHVINSFQRIRINGQRIFLDVHH